MYFKRICLYSTCCVYCTAVQDYCSAERACHTVCRAVLCIQHAVAADRHSAVTIDLLIIYGTENVCIAVAGVRLHDSVFTVQHYLRTVGDCYDAHTVCCRLNVHSVKRQRLCVIIPAPAVTVFVRLLFSEIKRCRDDIALAVMRMLLALGKCR